LQPVIEGRAFYRGEDIEVGGRDFVLLEECERGGEGALALALPAKHEVQRITDATPAEVGQHFAVTVNLVEPLVHLGERVGVDALQANVDVQQTTALGQVEELCV